MNIAYSITSKHQVTIPKEVRMKLGIKDRGRLTFKEDGGRVYITKVPSLEEVADEMSRKFRASGRKPATQEDLDNARKLYYKQGGKW